MILEKIKNKIHYLGIKQSVLISHVTEKGLKLTASQLSNFLSGKSNLSIPVVDAICEKLELELKDK